MIIPTIINATVDTDTGILRINISEKKATHIQAATPNSIFEFDPSGELVAIEILNYIKPKAAKKKIATDENTSDE